MWRVLLLKESPIPIGLAQKLSALVRALVRRAPAKLGGVEIEPELHGLGKDMRDHQRTTSSRAASIGAASATCWWVATIVVSARSVSADVGVTTHWV